MRISFNAAALVAVCLALSCSKEAPAKEQARSPQSATTVEGEEPTGAAKANYSEDSFDLKLELDGSAKAGQASKAKVVLTAKGPYKCNDKYPYKLELDDTPGVKYPAKTVKKDAVTLEKTKAVMTVAFTPESAGKKTIAGTFKFSVCTDDKCLIEKRKLALDILVD